MSLAIALRKTFDQGMGTLASGSHVFQLSSGGKTSTGVSITAERALRYAAFFAAVRILSESLAQMPLITYRRLRRGKERATDHWLYPVLHDRWNPQTTSFAGRETSMSHICTWGNAYVGVARDGMDRVRELWPLHPDRMQDVTRDEDTTALNYQYQTQSRGLVDLSAKQVFHVPGLAWDGVKGLPFLTVAREAVALGQAIEEYGGRFFANDARPGVVYSHPKTLNDVARANLRKTLGENHKGVGASWNFALLEEGMTVTPVGMPNDDAQFIETGKLQRSQIATIFRIPPHMLGDLDRATFSNIEHQSLEFVTYTLGPWLARWEQAIGMQLLGRDWTGNGGDYFVEFLVDGLLRGDIATRYAAYHQGRMDGWLSGDEIRERENLNPMPNGEGEAYWTPLNITTTSPDGTSTTTTLATNRRTPDGA